MPYQMVWVNSAADDKMAERGLLRPGEVARRAGKYPKWVEARLDAGELVARTIDGVQYVTEQSLNALMVRRSFSPSPWDRIEDLEAAGQHQEALWAKQELQARVNAAQGHVPTPSEDAAPPPTDWIRDIVRSRGGR